MGDSLILLASDGEYVTYGKELELLANFTDCRAALMFVISKIRLWNDVAVLQGYDALEKRIDIANKRDVSKQWLEYEKEEQF